MGLLLVKSPLLDDLAHRLGNQIADGAALRNPRPDFRGGNIHAADDGREIVATRYFIANDTGYLLTVVGATEPIESDPAFESFMQGFAFTSPPTQAKACV